MQIVSQIKISALTWYRLMRALRIRGNGVRESGAFLLGRQGTSKITDFICYDALDPHCLDTGIIQFDGSGYVPLWEHCERQSLQVLADTHTHPGSWTGQSELDQTNPMIVTKGHIALIIPTYAQNRMQGLKGVGIYEYLGAHKWRMWDPKDHAVTITLL